MFKYILAFIFLFSAFFDNPALSQDQPESPAAVKNTRLKHFTGFRLPRICN